MITGNISTCLYDSFATLALPQDHRSILMSSRSTNRIRTPSVIGHNDQTATHNKLSC